MSGPSPEAKTQTTRALAELEAKLEELRRVNAELGRELRRVHRLRASRAPRRSPPAPWPS